MNKTNNKFKLAYKGDGDEDTIIFNVKKTELKELIKNALKFYDNYEPYTWALKEGFKPESNGDIRINDQLVLRKRY